MLLRRSHRRGFAWLELLLALTLLALLFRFFPSLLPDVLATLDVRNWSRSVWMTLNVGVVLVLFGIQFGPELCADWRRRRVRVSGNDKKREKQLTMKEERELYERMREARKRQVI